MLSIPLPASPKITLHKTSDGYVIRDNEKNMKMSLSFDDYSKILLDNKKHQLNKIFKAVTKANKSKFKVSYEVSGEAFLTKPNKTTYMVQNIIKKVTGLKPKLSTSGGTSDARFIKNIAPCLEFGLVGKTMHKIDESVSVSDLKKLTKIYENILVSYFK